MNCIISYYLVYTGNVYYSSSLERNQIVNSSNIAIMTIIIIFILVDYILFGDAIICLESYSQRFSTLSSLYT